MNRNVHSPVGALAAGVQLSLDENLAEVSAAEIVGRLVGGLLGSRGPDWIDPPTNPGHRGVGHAILPVVTAFVLIARVMPSWQQALRNQAASARQRAADLPSGERWPLECTALGCEFVLGLIIGVPVGYASHLVLDVTTPAGLPLLARGL